jgi:hypothetical protein
MSLVLYASLLHLRNLRLLGLCCVPAVLIMVLGSNMKFPGPGDGVAAAVVALCAVAFGVAFFLGSSQRELLHRPLSFHQSGLYRRLRLEHAVLVVALVIAALAALLNAPIPAAVAWSVAGIAVAFYALVAVASLTLPWSSAWAGQLGAGVVLAAAWLLARTPHEALLGALGQPWPWVGGALALAVVLWRLLGSRSRHRALIEQLHLSPTDAQNPAKREQFMQRRSSLRSPSESSARPLRSSMQRLIARAARSAARRRWSAALAHEAAAIALLTGIPRRRLILWRTALLYLVLLVGAGYMGGRMALRAHEDGLGAGWFPGMVFMIAMSAAEIFAPLRTRSLGRLASRADLHRAGWVAAGWSVVAALLLSAVVVAAFLVGQLVLPAIRLGADPVVFALPPLHAPLLPLCLLPVSFLTTTLWSRRGAARAGTQAATASFFIFHGLLSFPETRLLAVGVAVAGWLGFAVAWRWRALRGDL